MAVAKSPHALSSAIGHLLTVTLAEGRNFPTATAGVACVATFANDTKVTPLSSGTEREPVWNCTLQWRVTAQQLAKLSSVGLSTCKVVFTSSDARKLGWVVLDLRTAKLNFTQAVDKAGVWLQLVGTARASDAPEVRVFHTFAEETLSPLTPRSSLQQLPSVRSRPGTLSKEPSASEQGQPASANRDILTTVEPEAPQENRQPDTGNAPSSAPSTSRKVDSEPAVPSSNAEQPGCASDGGHDTYSQLDSRRQSSSGAGVLVNDHSQPSSRRQSSTGADESANDQPQPGSRRQSSSEVSIRRDQPRPDSRRNSASGGPADHVPETTHSLPSDPHEAGAGTAAELDRWHDYPQPRQQPSTSHQQQQQLTALQQQFSSQQFPQPLPGKQPPQPTAGGKAFDSDLPTISASFAEALQPGAVRQFRLTLDVRSFQAGRRLPLNMAATFVQVSLPPALTGVITAGGGRVPQSMAPLKTHPPIDITRGSEGALPSGYATVEFTAGLMSLATMLARGPRLMAEVWHKERFKADTLMGVASIPLAPLLQESWVDGSAPVFAIMATAKGDEVLEEKVQVGALRMVMSLEELGPAPGAAVNAAAFTDSTPAMHDQHAALDAQAHDRQGMQSIGEQHAGHMVPGISHNAEGTAGTARQAPLPSYPQPQPGPSAPLSASTAATYPQHAQRAQQQAQQQYPNPKSYRMLHASASAAAAAQQPAPLLQTPEYQAAWELEVWKRSEEMRWRAELRERELERMAGLENEWRRREAQRDSELAGLRAEYAALEAKTRMVLAAAEEREAKLVAAEESLARRRKDLEREHGQRLTEAQAAVRRLQAECEHQLSLERDRNAELARQSKAAEERQAAAEARTAALEAEYQQFKDRQRSTPEAELARQLAASQEALQKAEERAERANKAKNGYKEQLVKLAQELGTLQRLRAAESAALLSRQQTQLESTALRLASEEATLHSQLQRQQLSALRSQLTALRQAPAYTAAMGTYAATPPTASPGQAGRAYAAHAPGQAAGLQYSQPQQQQQQVQQYLGQAPLPQQQPQGQQYMGQAAYVLNGQASPGPAQLQQPHLQQHDQAGAQRSTAQRGQHGPTGVAASSSAAPQQQAQHEPSSAGPSSQHSTPAPAHYGAQQQPLHAFGACETPGPASAQQQPAAVVPGQLGQQQQMPMVPGQAGQSSFQEVQRLLKERTELLHTGAYTREDPLIVELDQRIQQLASSCAG